jgi:hypothetical protein
MTIIFIIIVPVILIQVSNSTDKIPQVVVFDNESYIKKMKRDISNLIEAKLIENDILSTVVSYSGGCEKHEFTLGAVPGFKNTDLSPQANLVLGHENNGDTCKKIVRERLDFDLSPLKEKYQQVYGVKAGSIMLHLMNTTITIKYNFK